MSGWLLRSITIEGLRGINNEGNPLVLELESDAVNSVFAPNAVGKSSIFDALLFAIRGHIKKLDTLPAAEKGKDYYRNRFHSTGLGFVELALSSTAGQPDTTIKISLDANGNRVVSSPNCPDPEALLNSLNREFALLDYQTFHKFISDTPTDRGRSFAGLLGLYDYSQVRQFLQSTADTRAFRNHFQTADLDNQIKAKEQTIGSNNVLAHKTAASALGMKPEDFTDAEHIASEIEAKLASSPAIGIHCADKKLNQMDFDKCVSAILEAEGGEKKKKYADVVAEQGELQKLGATVPNPELLDTLPIVAKAWEEAMAVTSGADRLAVFKCAEKVLAADEWTSKERCPACDETAPKSVLDYVRGQLKLFEAAEQAEKALSDLIITLQLHEASAIEKRFLEEGELSATSLIQHAGTRYTTSNAAASQIVGWFQTLASRLETRTSTVAAEKAVLEGELPTSLVAITNLVGDSKVVANALKLKQDAETEKVALDAKRAKINRVKTLLDSASGLFGSAEGSATDRRLKKVQPIAKDLFTFIMSDDIVPDIKKSSSDEAITLHLEKFFNKQALSALALLSESYRNALAISLYLAAASLYGGAAKFIVLDDVTSSFDGGHQFMLMEALKSKLARPAIADGLQFVILSHDTLLEKLFLKNDQTAGWKHQKLEGTPSLIVTPTVGAIAKLRDATDKLLALGQLDQAATGIRMLLEAKLIEIISRLKIPVPLDFSISDHKKMVDNSVKAIQEAITLHQAAGSLKMSPAQVTNFSTNAVAAIGNFLSHFATGAASPFTHAALTQTLSMIDGLSLSFQFEDPPGSGNFKYFKSLDKVA